MAFEWIISNELAVIVDSKGLLFKDLKKQPFPGLDWESVPYFRRWLENRHQEHLADLKADEFRDKYLEEQRRLKRMRKWTGFVSEEELAKSQAESTRQEHSSWKAMRANIESERPENAQQLMEAINQQRDFNLTVSHRGQLERQRGAYGMSVSEYASIIETEAKQFRVAHPDHDEEQD